MKEVVKTEVAHPCVVGIGVADCDSVSTCIGVFMEEFFIQLRSVSLSPQKCRDVVVVFFKSLRYAA